MERDRQNATLNRLLCLCRDSENGFLVAAENVSNRGLKAMLRTCALERAEFAAALEGVIRQRGGDPRTRGSLLAAIHRGWIDLKAAMTFGPFDTETVVLAEALRGERMALQTYQRALEQPLPAEPRVLIAHQHERIAATREQIACLLGTDDERLVVRLFDQQAEAERARQALVQAGFDRSHIEIVAVEEAIRVYRPFARRSTIGEALLAAALLGLVVGGLIGAVVGISTFSALLRVFTATLVGAGIGAGILGLFGLLLGVGIAEEDTHLYDDGVQYGHVLMRVRTDPQRAFEATRILQGVNAAARADVALA